MEPSVARDRGFSSTSVELSSKSIVGQDFDDQVIGVWDPDIFWLKHTAWLRRHASCSLRFAPSLSLGLSNATILLQSW